MVELPKRALLVVDYEKGTGLGHLRRLAALSTALAARGWESRFGRATVDNTPLPLTGTGIDHLDPVDVSRLDEVRSDYQACVIDSYRIDARQKDALAPYVAIDDLGEAGEGAAIIINPAGGNYDAGPELLLGPKYALLGSDVVAAASASRPARYPPRQALVSLGASVTHELLAEVLAAIAEGFPGTLIQTAGLQQHRARVGKATGIANRIAAADLVVCAGGVTSLEAAALGRPALGLILAPNQRRNIKMLASTGTLLEAEPEPKSLAAAIASIDQETFIAMARTGPRVVDGHGAERVALAITEMFSGGV